MSDLDVFIKQHCQDDYMLEYDLTEEISDHLEGLIPYESLKQGSKDILDAWQVYCDELGKKIAR